MLIFVNSGQQSTLQCYAGHFTGILCESPTFIEVQTADYGKTTSLEPTKCNPDDRVCWQKVWQVNFTYYQAILNYCNGNQGCNNLQANWGQMSTNDCSGTVSDYVEIFYSCVTGMLKTNFLN